MAVISQKVNDDKRVELTISVGAEEFGKAIDAAYRKNVKRMQVPGFRKGKAPRKMIEKMYGEGVSRSRRLCALRPMRTSMRRSSGCRSRTAG